MKGERFRAVAIGTLPSTGLEVEKGVLARSPVELTYGGRCATDEEVLQVAGDADIIMSGGSPITRRVMEGLTRCRAIVLYGVGFDAVDLEAATERGIAVANTPKHGRHEVSDHAILLLLACARKLVPLSQPGRQTWENRDKWLRSIYSLRGRTLGLVAFGNIAQQTARKAKVFGLRVLAHDPWVDPALARRYGVTLVDLPQLLRESDFISVHVPLSKSTHHMIGERELALMKPRAYLINTARGAVLDEQALFRALKAGQIAGAGLDVLEKEPPDPDNPLLELDNVIITPHYGGYSEASMRRLSEMVAREVARVLRGRWPRALLNRQLMASAGDAGPFARRR